MATFGFDARRVLPALRLMPYDRLVVLAGRTATRSAWLRRLRAIEPGLRVVPVDPFDFLDCLAKARAARLFAWSLW